MNHGISTSAKLRERSPFRFGWYLALLALLIVYWFSISRYVGERNLVWDEAVIALSGLDLRALAPELLTDTYGAIRHYVRAFPYYPPLLPILLALSYSLIGISEFSVRIVSLVSSLLFPVLVFLFGREIRDEATGFFAALMLTATPTHYWMSRFGFLDMPMCILFTATIYLFYTGYERREMGRIVLSGFTLGSAFLFKYPAILCVPIILGYFLLDVFFSRRISWKKTVSIILGLQAALLVVIPWVYLTTTMSWKWQVWGFEIQPGKEYKWLILENWTGNIIQMPEQMSLLITVIGVLGLAYSAWRREKIDRLLLLWVAVVFLWFVPYHKDVRYTMPFIPAFVLAGSRLMLDSIDWLSSEFSKGIRDITEVNRRRNRLTALGVLLLIVAIGPHFVGWLTFTPDRVPVREAVAYVAGNIERERSVMILVPDNDLNHFATYFYLRMGGLPYGSGVHVYTMGKRSTGVLDAEELLDDCYNRRIRYLLMSDNADWSGDWVRSMTESPGLRRFFVLNRVVSSESGNRIVYILSYLGSFKQL